MHWHSYNLCLHFSTCAGVSGGTPVNSSKSSSELEMWAHQHWPEDRLQVQWRGHDDADGPQQRPVPRLCRWRGFKTTGCVTSCCMVQSTHRITERAVFTLRWFDFDDQLFFCPLVNSYRNAEQQRILWKIPDISQKSENGGMYSLIKETGLVLLILLTLWWTMRRFWIWNNLAKSFTGSFRLTDF